MDEATSALDADSEFKLYELLRTALPDAGFIVAAHREPRGLGNDRRIRLNTWRDAETGSAWEPVAVSYRGTAAAKRRSLPSMKKPRTEPHAGLS
jgi:ABC-type transport system involved in cytochrome bd biosynthesis fused ATPase/permease subunit